MKEGICDTCGLEGCANGQPPGVSGQRDALRSDGAMIYDLDKERLERARKKLLRELRENGC